MPEIKSTTTTYGHKFSFFSDDFIGYKIQKDGIYEKEVLVFLTQLLKLIDKAVVMDVGGNIGNHSLAFSQFAQHVYTFEPVPGVFHVLQKNIEDNNIHNITAINSACSNNTESATIFINENGNIGGSSFERCDRGGTPLTVTRLIGDQWVEQSQLDRIDLIKIDVEGHEYQVLDGLQETVAKHKPFVLLEWADEQTRDKIIAERLFETLFSDYSIMVLGTNYDKQYWFKKPFGKIRRKIEQLSTAKKPLLYTFIPEHMYENILLIPEHKKDLVEAVIGLIN